MHANKMHGRATRTGIKAGAVSARDKSIRQIRKLLIACWAGAAMVQDGVVASAATIWEGPPRADKGW